MPEKDGPSFRSPIELPSSIQFMHIRWVATTEPNPLQRAAQRLLSAPSGDQSGIRRRAGRSRTNPMDLHCRCRADTGTQACRRLPPSRSATCVSDDGSALPSPAPVAAGPITWHLSSGGARGAHRGDRGRRNPSALSPVFPVVACCSIAHGPGEHAGAPAVLVRGDACRAGTRSDDLNPSTWTPPARPRINSDITCKR